MKLLNKYFIPALALFVVFSCNPLEDAYDELDESITLDGPEEPIKYTFTSDEYEGLADFLRSLKTVEDSVKADFVETNEIVTSDVEVSGYLEEFVNDKYPQFGFGTAVLVTYNYMNATVPDYSMYLGAPEYELTEADYDAVSDEVSDAGFFYPSAPASDYIPSILSLSVQNAIDGDTYAISYMASSEDAVLDYSTAGEQEVFAETFDNGTYNSPVDGYFAQSVTGDQSWVWRDYSGDGYAYISGYSGGSQANEDWFVIDNVDLSDYSEASLSVYQACNYLSGGSFGTDIVIKVSSDFNGSDVTAATWTDVTPDVWPSGSDWTFVTSTLDISSFAGQEIAIGFYYRSTTDYAPGWEISGVTVTAPGSGPTLTSKAPVEHVDYYMLSGSDWELVDGVYTLTADDYDGMGTASGQPGRYNNFDGTATPDAYLPAFLNMTIDFPLEGDEYLILYKYYDGSTSTRATSYTYIGGSWISSYFDVTTKTDQLKRNSSKFVFDPSVEFTMRSSDYQMIVDVVKGTHPDLIDSYGTAEFYYGSGAYYENFDLGYTSRWSGDYEQTEYVSLGSEERVALMIQRMGEGIEVLLKEKYPEAAPIEGVDVTYTVTSDSYDGSDASWVTIFEVSGAAEFTLVEGPTKQ